MREKKKRLIQRTFVLCIWYLIDFCIQLSWRSEKAMGPHSSTLAWKIPWTEKTGRLQSMGSRRVGHDWATSLSLFTFMHWRRKWQPIPVFLPGESRDGGAWWAAIHGVAQSRTQLKRLSSSSSKLKIIIFTILSETLESLVTCRTGNWDVKQLMVIPLGELIYCQSLKSFLPL